MTKPTSQTLPPHEGEGFGVRVVYSSDWYKQKRRQPACYLLAAAPSPKKWAYGE